MSADDKIEVRGLGNYISTPQVEIQTYFFKLKKRILLLFKHPQTAVFGRLEI